MKISLVLALLGILTNACSHVDSSRSPASLVANPFVSEMAFSSGADLLSTAEPNATSPTAQEEEPWVRVAQSEIDPDARKSCAISALLISYLDESDEKEISDGIGVQIEELKKLYGKKPNKLQRKILKDLSRIERHQEGKDHFRKVFSSLCKAGRAVGGGFIRTGALTASAVTSALTLPIRFVFKAGIGVFTRKNTPEQGPGYTEVLGGRGLRNWSGPLYQTIRVAFFSGNPLLLGVYGVTSIDMQAQAICRSASIRKSEREQKFCSRYEAIKRGEFEVTEVGEKLGVKLGKLFLHTFDFREDGVLNSKICDKPAKRQVRIALKARERLEDRLEKDGYKNFQTAVVPPEVGGCVEISAQLDKIADREAFEGKESGEYIDGVSVALLQTKEEEQIEQKKKEEEEKRLATERAAIGAPAPLPSPLAETTPTPTPDYSDEKLCKLVYSMQGARALNGKENFNMQMSLLQFAINPPRFASLKLQEVKSPRDQLRREPIESRGRGKNIVYIVAPNEQQKKEYEEVSKKSQQIQAELKSNAEKFKKLFKEKTYADCLSKQEEIGFDWKRQEELAQSLRELSVAQRVTDFDALLKEAKKAGRRFFVLNSRRMQWEIRDYKHINQFRETLMNDEVRNVVFVSHADSTGKIIDSNLNLVPSTAFSWISPNIQSVSLFACHTDQLIRTFHVDEKLATQESFFPIRYLGMVDANEIFEKKNQAPSSALSEYLEDLDRELYRAEIGNERAQTAFGSQWAPYHQPDLCEFSFPGLSVKTGAAHIQFVSDGKNKYWAGVLDPSNSDGFKTQFPCDWVGKNIILGLENANPVESLSLESESFRFTLKDRSGKMTPFEPFKVGRNESGKIRSVKWKFEKVSEEGGVPVWKDYGSPEALKPAD